MAVPFLGRGGTIGFAVESTYGTAVSRDKWLRGVNLGLKRTVDNIPRPHLGDLSAASSNRKQFFVASDTAGGSVEVLAAYDDATVLLMKALLGANTTAGSSPYTHTLTLSNTDTFLTMEQILGTGSAEVFEGCAIASGEFSISVGDIARLKLDIIAETSQGLVSAGTPTYSSNGEEILHHQAGQFGWNSNNFDIDALTFKVDRKLARRQLLGSKLTAQPVPSDFQEVTGSITVEYTDSVPHAGFLAGTQSDGTLTFTGTGNNALALTFHNMLITDVAMPVSSAGRIMQTVAFRAFSDGTNLGLSAVFTNDNTAHTAN